MRPKNTSKAAAAAASANARAATSNGKEPRRHEPQPPQKRTNVKLLRGFFLLFFSVPVLWFLAPPNIQQLFLQTTNTSALVFPTPPEIANLSLLADSWTSSFDDFYAHSVQPLLDRGRNAFNGTRHEEEEWSRVGYQLRHARDGVFDALSAKDAPSSTATTTMNSNNNTISGADSKGAYVKHPVVMIPGFVTSGLELWEGTSCAKKHFRQRLWGSMSMARTFFSDRECWRKHLSLHPRTGMDPPNVRLRAAQGFEAADSFIATYWVWSKLIENLADVGYDGSQMTMMAYDWRLGYELMERRDGYFTKLKHAVEAHHQTSGEKVVLVSHSMGGTVVYYFLQWVVADAKYGGGGGGKDWIEKHIHAFVNIAGTLLGVPKSIPALLSGELKDIAVLFAQLGELLEQYFGRRWRKNLWNTWGSLFGMLPKGGNAIWGIGADIVGGEDANANDNSTDANQTPASLGSDTFTPTIIWNNGTVGDFCPVSAPLIDNATPITNTIVEEEKEFIHSNLKIPASKTWSMSETIDYIFQNGGGYEEISSSSIFSYDSKKGFKQRATSNDKRKHWHDPVATPLPRAPTLKIYCLYGVGIPTERAYYYKVACDKLDATGATNKTCPNLEGDSERSNSLEEEEPPDAPIHIDTAVTDVPQNILYGVRYSDGDTSVPLLSLGYMCQKWSEPKSPHNPSGIKVITRERKHEAGNSLSDPGRGGPLSGEHVDILGNVGVIEDVVRIATGFEVEEKVDEEIIVSDLKRIIKEIDGHPLGGLKNAVK